MPRLVGRADKLRRVTDLLGIVAHEVMTTPASVIEERLVAAGRFHSADELRTLLARVVS